MLETNSCFYFIRVKFLFQPDKRSSGIIDEAVKAGTNVFAFSRYVPSGGDLDASMTENEYRALLEICDRKFAEYEKEGCDTYFNKKDHLWTLYDYEMGRFSIPVTAEEGMIYGGCNCGNCHITILPSGEVYACRRIEESRVGIVCQTGILGGIYTLNGFDPIKDIPNGVFLTGFFSNYPSIETIKAIFDFIEAHHLIPKVGKVFDFDHVNEWMKAQDEALINGKIVVKL